MSAAEDIDPVPERLRAQHFAAELSLNAIFLVFFGELLS